MELVLGSRRTSPLTTRRSGDVRGAAAAGRSLWLRHQLSALPAAVPVVGQHGPARPETGMCYTAPLERAPTARLQSCRSHDAELREAELRDAELREAYAEGRGGEDCPRYQRG